MKNKIKRFFKNFKKVMQKPEMTILPGQLAYFFVLAIIPTLTLISMGAAFLNLSTDVIHEFLASALTSEIASVILSTHDSFSESGIPIIFLTMLAYYLVANGISSIIVTSNTIYGIEPSGYIRRMIKAFIITFILLFLIIFMLLIPMFGNLIIKIMIEHQSYLGIVEQIINMIELLQAPFVWFIIFLFIKLIYTMAPDKKINSRHVNYGAIFTTSFWFIVTYGYSIWVTNFARYDILYGNLANLIVIMLWIYFLSYIFTIGLALNYHKEEKKDKEN